MGQHSNSTSSSSTLDAAAGLVIGADSARAAAKRNGVQVKRQTLCAKTGGNSALLIAKGDGQFVAIVDSALSPSQRAYDLPENIDDIIIALRLTHEVAHCAFFDRWRGRRIMRVTEREENHCSHVAVLAVGVWYLDSSITLLSRLMGVALNRKETTWVRSMRRTRGESKS